MCAQILENVHQIKCWYPGGIYAACYLITDKKYLYLLDAGDIWSWEKDITPYIKKLGRDPREIRKVIMTHHHDDHMGGAAQIRDESGANLVCGRKTAYFLADQKRVLRWEEKSFHGYLNKKEKEQIRLGTDYNGPPRKKKKPLIVDSILDDNDVVDLGLLELRVVFMPGHTFDGYSYYDEKNKAIFTGDSITGKGTRLDNLFVTQDIDALFKTLERVGNMDIDMLIPAHPYLPFEKAVLNEEEAREFIQITKEINRDMGVRILETLKESSRPMSTPEISAVMCAEFGPDRPKPRSHGTVRLNLVKLLKERRVKVKRKDNQFWWSFNR